MVERRSPKPSVASSSLAWPAFNFFIMETAMGKVGQFFKECVAELRKVVWPGKEDVLSAVKVVLVSTVIIAALLGFFDWFLTMGSQWIFS